MKTVAVKLDRVELEALLDAFCTHLAKTGSYQQRQDGLELIQLWAKLQDAARDAGGFMIEDYDLPRWVYQKTREALTTAGQVRTLREKVEELETRAKARGVTAAAQPPTVTKARKKPVHKAKPKPAPAPQVTAPAQVS